MTHEEQRRVGKRLYRAMGKFQTCLTHVEVGTIIGKEDMTNKKDVKYSCND